MAVAYAHGLYEPLPENIFQVKWDWDPTLLFFVFLTFLYLRGLSAFRGKVPVKPWQKVCFFSGIAILVAALSPPIDPLSDRLFFMHMIQHLMIVMVGIPLILFGVPYYVSLRGLPPWVRRHLYFPIIKNPVVRLLTKILANPIVAIMLYACNFWLWHHQKFYNLALLNDAIHLVEHALMAFTAMLMWRNIIDPYPIRSPVPIPFRLLFLLALAILNNCLSAALTFAETVWYAYDGIPAPSWWTLGPLQDQQLGGLIMWIPGALIDLLAMTLVFAYWVRKERQKEQRLEKMQPPITSPTPVPTA